MNEAKSIPSVMKQKPLLFVVEFERDYDEDWDFAKRKHGTPPQKLHRQLQVEFQQDANFKNFPSRGQFRWLTAHQKGYYITVTLRSCGKTRTEARKVLRTRLQHAYDHHGVAGFFTIKD